MHQRQIVSTRSFGSKAHINLTLVMNTIRIEMDYGDAYAAQVAFDDLGDLLNRGEAFVLTKEGVLK